MRWQYLVVCLACLGISSFFGCGKSPIEIQSTLRFTPSVPGYVNLTIEGSLKDGLVKDVSESKIKQIVWESYNVSFAKAVKYPTSQIAMIPLDTLGILRGNCYIVDKDGQIVYLDLSRWQTNPSGGIINDGMGGQVIQLQFEPLSKGLIKFQQIDSFIVKVSIEDSMYCRLINLVDNIDSVGFASDVYGWFPAGLKQKYDSLPVVFVLRANKDRIVRGNFFITTDSVGSYFNLGKWKTDPSGLIINAENNTQIIEYKLK